MIERFVHGARPVYERAAERGRMLPEGVTYVESWVSDDLGRCYQVVKTETPDALADWISRWSDLVEFEVVPVVSSAEAARRALA